MTTTTEAASTAREAMYAEQARQRGAVLRRELAAEHESWTTYRANMTAGSLVAIEMRRPGHLRPTPTADVVRVLAEVAGILAAEDARHTANVARIMRALAAIPGEVAA